MNINGISVPSSVRRWTPVLVSAWMVLACAPAVETPVSPAEPRVPVPGSPADAVRDAMNRGDTARALELVRSEIANPGRTRDAAALRLLEGRLLLRQGERDSARTSFTVALSDSTWSGEALDELQELAIERGEFEYAEALLRRTTYAAPSQVIHWRAQAAFVRGEFDSAYALLSGDEGKSDPQTRLLTGNVALARGQVDEAESHFDGVIRDAAFPITRALAHFGKARASARIGARATRILEDEASLKESPLPAASLDAGIGLRDLGRPLEARRRLEDAARDGSPCRTSARLALAGLDREAGSRDAMREMLVTVLNGDVADAFAQVRLAESLRAGGRWEEAEFLFRSGAEALPEFLPVFARVSASLLRSVDGLPTSSAVWDSLSLAVGDRLLEGELSDEEFLGDRSSIPASSPRRLLAAMTRHLGGNWAGAIGWCEGATVDTPGLALVRALSFERVGRLEEARVELDRLAEAGRSSWLIDERRARLLRAEEREAFDAIVDPLLAARPRDARLRIRLARWKERAGDLAGSIALLRQARESGWLTQAEKQSLRERIEDLQDLEESNGPGKSPARVAPPHGTDAP